MMFWTSTRSIFTSCIWYVNPPAMPRNRGAWRTTAHISEAIIIKNHFCDYFMDNQILKCLFFIGLKSSWLNFLVIYIKLYFLYIEIHFPGIYKKQAAGQWLSFPNLSINGGNNDD